MNAVKVRNCCLVDLVAVERVTSAPGRVIPLNHCEQRQAVKVLHSRGFTDAQIGAHIGVGDSRVYHLRRELGLPAVNPNLSRRRAS